MMRRKKKVDPNAPVVVSTEPRKIKRRAKKGKGNKDKYYFNADTQAAIVAYQQTNDPKARNDLYVNIIQRSFTKLAENLINIHKFTGWQDSYSDLRQDCESFLVETITKFDSTRGTNAFSYFNVVAKNWLIIKTKQKNSKIKSNVSLDSTDLLTTTDIKTIEEYQVLPSQDETTDLTTIINENTFKMLDHIKDEIKTENEKICIDSIVTIFENVENIDLLNKNAIMLYLRELSRLNSKQLTTSLQSIKKIYRRKKSEVKDN